MNFLQGTLDVLILTALADSPLHGYDVVEWIRSTTDGSVEIDDGALYMALHRMERRGWLAWRTSVSVNLSASPGTNRTATTSVNCAGERVTAAN